MSAKIDKIVLEVGGKKIEMSPKEAKELKDILNELYGSKEIQYIPQPYPVDRYWPRPWRYTTWEPIWGTTTVSSGTSLADNVTTLTLSANIPTQ